MNQNSKGRAAAYWVSTALISLMMLGTAYMYLTHAPAMMTAFGRLGYPAYFPNLLGVAKLLGVCALLAPGMPLVKEWAYAGFTITFVSAIVSHIASGDAKDAPGAAIALLLLTASYATRPADRRVAATRTAT